MQKHYYLNIEHIKQIMQERGIDEKQLAEKIGITKKCLNSYLTQYREKVPSKIFMGIYNALNVPFYDLVILLSE